jgi:hypothetical protein
VAKLPDLNRQKLIRGVWADRGPALWKGKTANQIVCEVVVEKD